MSGFFVYPVISAVVGTILYANLPTKFTIGKVLPTVKYLSDATLKKIDSEKSILTAKEIKASEIFNKSPVLVYAIRRPGCAFCREQASALSEIVDKLKNHGVKLVGVVHETLGVDQFRPFLKGDIYFDQEKRFYGPKERWLPLWMGFLRISTYLNYYRTTKSGYKGNMEGEGRLLGGVYLINKDAIIMAHPEEEWGDQIDVKALLKTIEKME